MSVPAHPQVSIAFRALFVVATVSVLAAVIAACGGEEGALPSSPDADVTDTDATTTTSGDDDATTAAPPASGDAASDGPMCATTLESLLEKSEQLSAGCVSCYEQNCAAAIKECDTLCSCPEAFNSALECFALGGNQQTCTAVALQTLSPNTLLQFYQCTSTCKKCKPSDASADAPGDGPNDAAGDSAADASADASDSSADAAGHAFDSGGDGASDAGHD